MKKWGLSRRGAAFLALGLVLLISGTALLVRGFSYFAGDLRRTAAALVAYGCVAAIGAGILLVLFLHMLRRPARVRKEAEAMEKLNRQIQELAHHQRLETIGMMTSSIAHEFNNLLVPIMGYSMMALEKLPPEEELYDDILEIYNASRKAKTIISRLSDLSRKNTSTTFRPVSVDEVVRRTLDVAEPARPDNVQIKLDLNCWDQRIQANEIQLNQLLLNLILNGFHAMGDGPGTLTLATAFDERHIHIRVEDTGCGIPEDVLPKIFEPFFTTKDTGRGTGLGLAIAAQVAEDHKGTIRVESKVGEGTCFKVSLPRFDGNP